MTSPAVFDERARTLTTALLKNAERTPARAPQQRVSPARWKVIAAFAGTVLVISAALVGASIALHNAAAVKPAPAAHAGRWKSFELNGISSSPDSISCPDAANCVAVDYQGDVITSTNPGGGAAAWKVTPVDPAPTLSAGTAPSTLTGVSCADPSLCVAVDQSGNVITSTNPGGGAAAWTVSGIDGLASFSGISCPDEAFCVAVGGVGPYSTASAVIATSTNPAGGPGTWTATVLGDASPLTAVTCPSPSLCVAFDQSGDVLTSTDPTGGQSNWKMAGIDQGVNLVSAVTCPTVFLCIAVDSGGNVATSTNPTGGAGAWTVTSVDASLMLDSVSCASATFCMVGALSDSVLFSTNPTGGSAAWTRMRVIPQGIPQLEAAMFGLSCPSNGFCVGVDGNWNVHVYTNPTP